MHIHVFNECGCENDRNWWISAVSSAVATAVTETQECPSSAYQVSYFTTVITQRSCRERQEKWIANIKRDGWVHFIRRLRSFTFKELFHQKMTKCTLTEWYRLVLVFILEQKMGWNNWVSSSSRQKENMRRIQFQQYYRQFTGWCWLEYQFMLNG